jgi:hypothetical protein
MISRNAISIVVVVLVARADAQREAGWELKVPERVELAPGASGTLPITLALDRGLVLSKDAALILDLAPDAGVTVKKRRLGRADAVDPDADAPRFQVAVRADAAGDFTLKLHLRFWLCGSKLCRPVDARRTVAVAVAAPPPPAPAVDAGVDAAPPSDASRRR